MLKSLKGLQPGIETSLEFQPLPYEVDYTGFLSNTVCVKWMERLRIKLIGEFFSAENLMDQSNVSVISKTEIAYLKPIRISDRVIGHAKLTEVLSVSWRINFIFSDQQNKYFHMTAHQTGVFIDPVTHAPKRMPVGLKKKIAELNSSVRF